MAFRLEPTTAVERELKRVARERIDDALARLDAVDNMHDPAELETAVHEVRKRCKEVRGLARLVRPALGDEFARFNRLVRDAAEALSSIRDAHAVLATFDDLRAASGQSNDERLRRVRDHQATLADEASRSLRAGDARIHRAHQKLTRARRRIKKWRIPDGFDPLGQGLLLSYRRGVREMARARQEPTDEHMHEWRKAVKTLWYQTRLLEQVAPSMMVPLIGRLDDLAAALGDDHDLAVLVERLRKDPAGFGGKKAVKRAVALATDQQAELRHRASRLGATVYAESPTAFVDRVEEYWNATLALGPEVLTGGIAELAGAERQDQAEEGGVTVERERKFLVTDLATLGELMGDATEIRQGYLALDGNVSVRVRDTGKKRTLTVKAGSGPVRTELEWPMGRSEFEAAWELTQGRRVHKLRYRVPLGCHVVELDVFSDELEGLVVAEVEFDTDEAMAAFEPPPWFGADVSDDLHYTNASLAVEGMPLGPATDSRSSGAIEP